MVKHALLVLVVMALLLPTTAFSDFDPNEHVLFSGDAVHEIHLTFHQTAWYDSLVANFEGLDDPLYLAAEFDWSTVHFDSIGVRFKGNSSYYSYPTDKKSFKLDINEYIDGQDIDGLDKLNLNNGFKDPSFIRERCFWELAAAAGLPYLRTNHAALYINGTYWGLYALIEQVDNEFIESRFGGSEDGNLFKGDPHGTLQWEGSDQTAYYDDFELKTNEDVNDWSDLVDLIDEINNTPTVDLPDSLSPVLEVNSAMAMLALNNLTVNLDSYNGSGHNYYLYHRDYDDRFALVPWDANEAWGCFNMGLSVPLLKTLPPQWLNWPPPSRPLAERLWTVADYWDVYVGHLQALMAGAADPDTLLARMVSLRDLIRPSVYADTKKMYTNQEFDDAMAFDIGGGPGGVSPGLEPFIRDRHSYLTGVIGTYTPRDGLVLNELMAVNNTTVADEFGEFDDWIELANTGPVPIALSGLYLTDDMAFPQTYALPDTTLEAGDYLVIWADDDTEQGPLHAAFKLTSGGETVFLLDGAVVADQVTFPPLGADQSYGRWPDGNGVWELLSEATPGAENQNPEQPEEIVLFLNEFLAKNDTNIQDEAGEYEDWVEIYNPGPDPVEMGGLYLTDDLASTTNWSFPDTTLPAEEFLIVWCDDDPGDGPLHATFKLGGSGEEIGLFGRLAAGNEEIDSYVFGAQSDDVSEGRQTDGGLPWVFFTEPTPGASNEGLSGFDPVLPGMVRLLPSYPNPFNPATLITYELPAPARVSLVIYDVTGRRVKTLRAGSTTEAGRHEDLWYGRDDTGRLVAAGVYFYRLQVDNREWTRRMVLVK